MHRLIPITSDSDIPEQYRLSPIRDLLAYHNFNEPFKSYSKAELLVGMCMDNRKQLHIPDQLAFIIRTGGGNLRDSEFKVSFAIAVGQVKAIALIGHTQCGMVNLMGKKKTFVEGLTEQGGWDKELAEEHFLHYAPMFEIGNEIDFTLSECKRLRVRYPKALIAPLIYKVEENRLYLMAE